MKDKDLGIQIVVIENGFVHVGLCTLADGFLRIDNCKNLRVWGTQYGLGQLVDGPTKDTKYDPCGTVLVPFGKVVFFLQTTGGWS